MLSNLSRIKWHFFLHIKPPSIVIYIEITEVFIVHPLLSKQ